MNIDFRPWRRLLAVWLPAVALCVVSAAFYIWQTSDSGGRRTQIREQIGDLEQEIARLERIERESGSDRKSVATIDSQFDILYRDVFGDLDERLTRILRSVGTATREAGILPGSFSYSASNDRTTGFIRFGIRFSVEAEYHQIRKMLAALQSDPEFLVVETLNLAGDEEQLSSALAISISVATFLAEADEAQLRRLTGGITDAVEDTDG